MFRIQPLKSIKRQRTKESRNNQGKFVQLDQFLCKVRVFLTGNFVEKLSHWEYPVFILRNPIHYPAKVLFVLAQFGPKYQEQWKWFTMQAGYPFFELKIGRGVITKSLHNATLLYSLHSNSQYLTPEWKTPIFEIGQESLKLPLDSQLCSCYCCCYLTNTMVGSEQTSWTKWKIIEVKSTKSSDLIRRMNYACLQVRLSNR